MMFSRTVSDAFDHPTKSYPNHHHSDSRLEMCRIVRDRFEARIIPSLREKNMGTTPSASIATKSEINENRSELRSKFIEGRHA